MTIYLTFDYEVYFGKQTGSVMKCLIEPTNLLLEIAQRYQAKMTFFVDCGYLLALKRYDSDYPSLKEDFKVIEEQLKRIVRSGHSCQLHIHPHWEDSYYDGKWQMNISRYKLSDFSEMEIVDLFKRSKAILESITGQEVSVYRAGGWCLQPFDKIKTAFIAAGIKTDSSVYKGGYLQNETHFFDFRKTPSAETWHFTDDLCRETENGLFTEIPISAHTYSPIFFWKLFGIGRIFKSKHKTIGDGQAIIDKGMKYRYLTSYQRLPVSSDGYFVSKLPHVIRQFEREGKLNMVVIGHPKACTRYSFKKLEAFIGKETHSHDFLAMRGNA